MVEHYLANGWRKVKFATGGIVSGGAPAPVVEPAPKPAVKRGRRKVAVDDGVDESE